MWLERAQPVTLGRRQGVSAVRAVSRVSDNPEDEDGLPQSARPLGEEGRPAGTDVKVQAWAGPVPPEASLPPVSSRGRPSVSLS